MYVLNRSSRRKSALTAVYMERTHVRCYELESHGVHMGVEFSTARKCRVQLTRPLLKA